MNIVKLTTSNWLIIVFGCILSLTSCTTEIINLDETCTVTGKIVTRDEFGIENNDAADVTVSLDKTDFSVTTDAHGIFIFEDVPIGSYDLKLTKEGYGFRIIPSIIVFKGTEFLDLKQFDLIQPSTITIQNFRIEIEGSQRYACGYITHKFPYVLEENEYIPDAKLLKNPQIAIYFHSEDDVSDTNYMRYYIYDVFFPSKTDFRIPIYSKIWYPPQGQTYYYVAYGKSIFKGYENVIYDPETGFNKYYSILQGEASNIFSITNNE